MAVIRQTTQFVNRPIGVVRASSGGESIGQAISAGATALANEFYREAATVAQETGQKEAMAQSSEDIVSIDPETGNPVAYKAPDSYGSIASRAYQDLIDRRFQESLVEEIQEKGSEFASSAGSAAAYKEKMSQYIGEMYKSAVSDDGDLNAYGRQIKEAGEKYVASTYATLRKKEIAAYKKKVNRANKLAAYQAEMRIDQSIKEGVDPDEISAMLDSEAARNQSLLEAGGSVSHYIKMDKKITGQRALLGSRELVGIYSDLSEVDRLRLEQAIVDPNQISAASIELGIDDLGLLIAQSGGAGNASSTLGGLRSVGKVQDSIEQRDGDGLFEELSVTATTPVTLLEQEIKASGVSEQAQNIARQQLYQTIALKALDSFNLDSVDMSVIANELKSENYRVANITKMLPSGIRSSNVALSIPQMSSEDRIDLANLLTDRQTDLSKIEAREETQLTNNFKRQMVALSDSENLLADYQTLTKNIEENGGDNFKSLLTNTGEIFVGVAMKQQRGIQVSADEYDRISAAVKTGDPFTSDNEESNKIFTLLQNAYAISESTVRAEMDARGNQLNSNAKERVDSSILSAIETAALKGMPLQQNDLERLDKSIFGGKPFFLVDLKDHPDAANMFNAGTILPTVRRAISAALDSNSETEIEAGAILFRQGSTASGKLASGEKVEIDLMRSALSVEDYSLYQSLMYANSRYAESPTSVLMTLRNYEGDLNQDLMKDFGQTGSDLLKIFDGGPAMSPQYKREIIASLKVAKAKGGRITQDTLDRLISSYQDYSAKDESVTGPYIGDQSVYARTNFFSQSQILSNKAALTDLLVDLGGFDDLVTGGTFTDSALASIQNVNPLAFLFSSMDLGASMFGDISRMEKTQARARIKAGLASIDVPLLYRPNVQSFNNGVPSYDVGYDDGFGFVPITLNNEVWTLTLDSRPSLSRGDAQFQNLRQFQNAVRAKAPLNELYSAEIKYLATLEHVTQENFQTHKRYSAFKRGMDQDPTELFIDARREYEELP